MDRATQDVNEQLFNLHKVFAIEITTEIVLEVK